MVELATDTEPVTPPVNGEPASTGRPSPPKPDDWKVSSTNGRQYIGRNDGRQGVIWRQGDESIAEARTRDSTPRDKRPRKSKRPKMPEAPRKVDLKELEATLAEALKAPAMLCATFGDEWAAEHFTVSGPYLARNLILASEHNPWLRQKLEEAATGQDAMMKVVSLVGVGGACFAYAVPPIIWWFNLPAPRKTREMFGIPERRQREPAYAASPESPAGAEGAAGAEPAAFPEAA
jgi:hypothetical protein